MARQIAVADVRALAAKTLTQVIAEGRSLSLILPPAAAEVPARERGLLLELCHGTLRWGPRLEFCLRSLLCKPLRSKDQDIYCLLLLGLYQLLYLRVPPYAVVNGTVTASRALGKPWAAALVNGILRNFEKQRKVILADAETHPVACFSHPEWLLNRLQTDHPECWRTLVEANNVHPPMVLRVNKRHLSRDHYLAYLIRAGMPAFPAPYTEEGVILDKPVMVEALPGFAEGWVSVQDAAAQLAAPLLKAQAGERVLDACAAPGGKAAHILERQPALMELVTIDNDAVRVERMRGNFIRLGITATMLLADAETPTDWWDGRTFDRILLDAPCSATGVIRRHSDIKYLRRAADIRRLASLQTRLLEALWPLLKPGGTLLYCTCSVLPEENSGRIQTFLARHPDANEHLLEGDWGRTAIHGRWIMPGKDNMDGFYYACLAKQKQ